jgi:glucose/arabinose dehydrogenase
LNIDSNHWWRKQACLPLLLAAGLAVDAMAAIVTDPVPTPIVKSGIAAKLIDFVTVPPSDTVPALARISMLNHAHDGSGRLFVNDLRGKLYVIDQGQISVYLDLAGQRPDFVDAPYLGTGFQSFAFHPDFATSGRFYTVHTETPGTVPPDLVSPTTVTAAVHSVVTEWTASDPAANTFSGTNREVVRIEQPTFLHSLQEIGFNPNAAPGDPDYGMLYMGQGDGGELFTTNPQGLDSPHGAILRIDPLGNNSGNGHYGIPADNPFAGDGKPSTLGEIWAYGFRNPHRFSWDTGGDHKMLIGDIGHNNVEEVNLGAVGNNYGWNAREGTFVFDPNLEDVVQTLPPNDATLGYTYPVAQYDHDEGDSIVGGFVYRGTATPVLYGKYLFGDIVRGRIFLVDADALVAGSQAPIDELTLLDENGAEVTLLGIVSDSRADLRFGIDAAGEIYVMTKRDGVIRRLVSAAPDSDGDGLADDVETFTGTNPNAVDSDGDGLVDGDGGVVSIGAYPGGVDGDVDGYVDGERTLGTNPAVSNKGDVGPRGNPDDQFDLADLIVLTRLVTRAIQPTTLESALGDINSDSRLDAADILLLQKAVLEHP